MRETVSQVRSVVHNLARTSFSGSRERTTAEQQSVPSYSGLQSCLLPYTQKSKEYYHVMHNEPPKKSVIYDVINKLLDTMKEKGLKFLFLAGDLATYMLILELQTESVQINS